MPRIRGLLTISRRRWNLQRLGRGCQLSLFGPGPGRGRWLPALPIGAPAPCFQLVFCAESVLIVVYTVNGGGINCYLYFFDFILLFFCGQVALWPFWWPSGPSCRSVSVRVDSCRIVSFAFLPQLQQRTRSGPVYPAPRCAFNGGYYDTPHWVLCALCSTFIFFALFFLLRTQFFCFLTFFLRCVIVCIQWLLLPGHIVLLLKGCVLCQLFAIMLVFLLMLPNVSILIALLLGFNGLLLLV